MTSKEWSKKFSVALHNKMGLAGMTNGELADHTGVSESCISRYTRCEVLPSAVNCVKIADALNCSVSELIDFHEMIRD